MTSRLEMPFHAFFVASENQTNFRELLRKFLSHRGALSLHIGTKAVILTLETGDDQGDDVLLSGRWRSCVRPLVGDAADFGLLIPILFRASCIRLPYSQASTLGLPHRSIADFFARNVFYAVIRGAVVRCEESEGAVSAAAHDFQRHYFYIVKALFPEKVFKDRGVMDVLDLIVANSYLPILVFENHLLQRASERLRTSVLACADDPADLKGRLMRARQQMLTHYC